MRLDPAALALKVTHHLGVRHKCSQVLGWDCQSGMSPLKSKVRLLIANSSPFQKATLPAPL